MEHKVSHNKFSKLTKKQQQHEFEEWSMYKLAHFEGTTVRKRAFEQLQEGYLTDAEIDLIWEDLDVLANSPPLQSDIVMKVVWDKLKEGQNSGAGQAMQIKAKLALNAPTILARALRRIEVLKRELEEL